MKEKLDAILTAAFEIGTSDIHLTVGVPPMMRLNGELKKFGQEPLKPSDTEEMAKAIIPDSMWKQFKETGELDFSYGIEGVSRFRVNAFHQRSCISLAIRVIPTRIPTFDELGLPSVLSDLAIQPQGLILVTGPTGSGKSTTLAAMLDKMNRTVKKHIITLEDPIEYLHKHGTCIIDQREIGFDTKSFSNALRACLRQDPDVILVGEMRDLETISTAITAAETGHLVLATLHTTDAPTTIDRIIDVFPSEQQAQVRIQLASVLRAIISQRLFQHKQQNSRIGAFEILINNPAIRNLIRNEKIHQIQSVMQTSKAAGMQTMQMAIQALVEQEKISANDARPYLLDGVL
ncbi:twitching motility protein PilT [Heyndrickxia shackletonii]|uniref:Twitching motility protein PilT n=1 Tax=Heyndrickxia shackletonii TaxID=157838 RepID=A0A0Q3TID6_9BACI|nr:type IV pilus twitching motility protein PilT [Heyndrickxia shackletonii]KQL53393.1 twitching motility protein PilT [Heyndrickxia shackletonii]NEY99961.1 type IV pilus twitching motility protein PilT [Heyndrickxia shackletonii]